MPAEKPSQKGKEINPEEGTYILVGGSDDEEDPDSFQADIVGTPDTGEAAEFPTSMAEYAKSCKRPGVKVIDINE